MKRLAFALPLLAAAVACHRSQDSSTSSGDKPVAIDRKLEAPPPPPDVTPTGPAAGEPADGLEVIVARPKGELQGLNRATVTFNRPVVALATLDQGDAANPAGGFTLEPKASGKWHWLGSTSVEFVPDAQLPYSTEFKVTVPAGLAALDGSKLAQPYTFSFTTPRIEQQSSDTLPEPSLCKWSTAQQQFQVVLNQPLANPARAFFFQPTGGERVDAQILKSVNVSDEQRANEAAETDPTKRRHFERASSDALKFKSQVTRYQLQPSKPLPLNAPFALALDGAALAAQGPLLAKSGWQQACSTYGAMEATKIVRCWDGAERCSHGPVSITFTNPLGKISELRSRLHIEPAVALDWDEQDADLGVELGGQRTDVRIPARWKPGTTYTITLDAGVLDKFGQKAAAFQGTVTLDDLEPSMFVGRDVGLLEASGDGLLPVQTTNVPALNADLWQLTPSEWLALRTCDAPACRYPARPPDASPRTPLTDPKNEPRIHGIDIRAAFKDGKKTGLALVRVWSPNTTSEKEPGRVLIQVTDVIAHAKVGLTGGVVWVTSAQSASPRPGAQVVVYGGDGKPVAQATADEHGLATLPPLAKMDARKTRSWEQPSLVVAATDQGDTGVVTTLWDDLSRDGTTASFDGLSPRAVGVVFTDRGIYRPGDTVHVKGVLRHFAGASPSGLTTPAGVKINFSMTDPDGKSLANQKQIPLSRYGTFSLDVVVPADGRLGSYDVRAEQSGGGTWSGSFTVAEYRAPTFRVDLLAGKSEIFAGDPLGVIVSARYLFGGAMKGAKATWSVTRSTTDFAPPRSDGFSFGRQTWGYDEGAPVGDNGLFASGDGTIDAQGNLAIDSIKPDAPGDRPATYTIESEVQDVSRQTVAGRTSVLVHPAKFYVGIADRSLFSKAGEPMNIGAIAAQPDGVRLSGVPVHVTALLRAWHSVRKKGVGGVYESVSEMVDEPAGSCDVKTGDAGAAAASCQLVLAKAGFYTLRAEAKDEAGHLALSSVGVYALGADFAAWARGDSPKVELVADKAEYAVGDIAHVLIKSPYPECSALISTEREGVIDRRVQHLVGTATSIDVPITEAMVPNVFVGVVLQRQRVEQGGIEAGDDPGRPAVKAGNIELSVGRAIKRLSVEIQVPKEEWRPRQVVPIDLAVKDSAGQPRQAEITVYAVDEGVLRLTDYHPPDPLVEMFPRHSLGVALGEPLLSLVRRQRFNEKGEVQPGGGGGKGPSGARNKFVTTALWTTVETDSQGHAQAKLELPDNLTTFRIMAVATTDADRFGVAENHVRVSLPLLVLPALPRFARSGDAFEAGVVVNAKGLGAPQSEVKVSAQLSGTVALAKDQPAEQTVTVEEGVAREVRFKLVATGNGVAKMIFKASAAGAPGAGGPFADGVEQSIPVQLPTDLESVAVYGETANKSVEGLIAPESVRPGAGGLHVTMSSTALGGLADGMQQLVQYPYGCLEQLSSRLVPFLAIREISRVFGVDPGANVSSSAEADEINQLLAYITGRDDGATPADPDAVVASTVRKIEDLQTPSGGFRYWPADSCAMAWPSIYATLSLYRAKELGYAVDPSVLANAKKFVAQKAAGTSECPYEHVGPETRAFALQVLARTGAPLPAYYDELFAAKDKLPLFGKALLADAIAVGKGKRANAQSLLQEILDHAQETPGEVHFAEVDSQTYAPLFSSDVRTTGMVLQTLVDVQPGHPFVGKIARYFAAVRRKTGGFRNTQEAAYALMGLTEVVRVREKTAPDFTAKVTLAGKELLSQPFKGRSLAVVTKEVPIDEVVAAAKSGGKTGAPFVFSVDGQGLLEYGARLTYAPATMPMNERDEGIFVQRWIEPYDADGRAATTFQAGELVRVRVRVATRMERHYVAVEVPLPAGLEAVDLQLATSAHAPTAPHQEANEGGEEEGYDDQGATGGDDGEVDDASGWFYSPFIWSEKRDDRVIYFSNLLPPGVNVQSFVARATTPGTFLLKPAKAEEMYTPEVFGRSAGGTITVVAQKPVAQK